MTDALMYLISIVRPLDVRHLAICNVLPAFLVYLFSKGVPGRIIWTSIALMFGWLGYVFVILFARNLINFARNLIK